MTQEFEYFGSNSNLARSYNERIILKTIQKHRKLNRKHISDYTKLSTPTVSTITADLIQNKMVQVVGKSHDGGRGQPKINLALNPAFSASIGIEITDDILDIYSIDFSGKEKKSLADPIEITRTNNISLILDKLSTLIKDKEYFTPSLGYLGLAHNYDEQKHQMPSYVESILTNILERFGSTFLCASHAQCAAIAEELKKTDQNNNDKNALYIWVGNQLDSAIILNGEVYFGQNGRAGSQLFLSKSNIDFKIQENKSTQQNYVDPNSLKNLSQQLSKLFNIENMHDLVENIQQEQIDYIEKWVKKTAISIYPTLYATAQMLDLKKIIIGSSLPENFTVLIVKELMSIYSKNHINDFSIEFSTAFAGPKAPLIGAAYLPIFYKYAPRSGHLLNG